MIIVDFHMSTKNTAGIHQYMNHKFKATTQQNMGRVYILFRQMKKKVTKFRHV